MLDLTLASTRIAEYEHAFAFFFTWYGQGYRARIQAQTFFQFINCLRVNFQLIAGVFAMLFLVLLWREFARAPKLLTLDETALKNVIENSAANTANEKNYQRPKPRRT